MPLESAAAGEAGKTAGAAESFLFLDFDGVLCDSLEECFYSSAIAYFREFRGAAVPAFDGAYRADYRSLRPFVRNGEDYLLIHELLSKGKKIPSQAAYDRFRSEAGPALLDRYLALFTETRRALIAAERGYWLSLNPIYPFILPLLPRLAADPGAFILSTKKKEFLVEILAARGLAWDGERILSLQDRPKCALISEFLDGTGSGRAILIDDQIEHLKDCLDERIDRRLALWGYAIPGASAPGVGPIDEGACLDLLESFLGRKSRS